MAPIRETLERMAVVQEHDRRAMRLQREVESIPKRRQQLDQSIEEHRKAEADAEESLKRGLAAAHAIEVEVSALRDKIRRLQTQQFEVKSNDDYRLLSKEIDDCEKEIRRQEDRELEHMEQNEHIRERVEEQKRACARQAEAIRQESAAMELRAQEVAVELEAMQEERQRLIADIDPDWLARYERLLHHMGDYALVPIESGTCGGCHMKLPPQLVQDARRAETVSSCVYCGRLLYWP